MYRLSAALDRLPVPLPALALLTALCFAVYANGFDHAFNLDSGHVLVENPGVRSLRHVPSYFADPSTFTTLRSNVDYRPVLQTTYALNYAVSGYDMWSWHFTQILLHLACVLGLYCLCLRVQERADTPGPASVRHGIALAAATIFALHPTASGVVNYLSARSSLLTAAFLLPAFVLYMVPFDRERYTATAWGSAILFALALFTKVEAIGALAVFFLYDVWQTAARGPMARSFFTDIVRSFNGATLKRLWPMLAVGGLYFVIRQLVMAPFEFDAARQSADVGPYQYLLTQVVVWWEYVLHWFAPVGLVADNGAHTVFRSVTDPQVLLALGGWIVVAAVILVHWWSAPHLAFLGISALALLSPTSSIAPLAEMMNEHRPYLPLAVLSLAWTIPVGNWMRDSFDTATGRAALALGLGSVVVALGLLTFDRNRVFATETEYWQDVVEKAPSARAYVNYGLTFMRDGDYATARDYFERSLGLAPYWHITHINLAIARHRTGRPDLALMHYDRAVEYDTYTGAARSYRGEHYLELGRFAEAREDFEASQAKSLEHYRNYLGLATAHAGLGEAAQSYDYTLELLALDPERVEPDIVSIVGPFFRDLSLARAGIDYLQRLNEVLPDRWWVYHNLATLAARLGEDAQSRAWMARADALRSASPSEGAP